jgi:4-phytase/acid phosphatase
MNRTIVQWLQCIACLLVLNPGVSADGTTASSPNGAASTLKFVVYLSRHGVRSPTGTAAQYSAYSIAPWPAWDVSPGYLTAHGYHLMELFGEYDRQKLASQGLLSADGCLDASKVSFYADSDQRTRETGKALAEGLFPGCHAVVQALPEGTNDPLFHFHPTQTELGAVTPALAATAIAGRVGGDPADLTEAYRTQLEALDRILATCGSAASPQQKRTSLFDIPATLTPGSAGHLAELQGPLNTASTLAENLLLEYAQGLDAAQVGWGCVDGAELRSLMELHAVATDFTERTPVMARIGASNLLAHICDALAQAVTQKALSGARSKPSDRALFLIGHDTNLTNLAGLLSLTWIADGRRDDTPPGGALSFELWQDRKSGEFSVRAYFTVQTLEQMRSSIPLTLENPPVRVPVFIPGCSREDFSCTWAAFSQTIRRAIDVRFVSGNQ